MLVSTGDRKGKDVDSSTCKMGYFKMSIESFLVLLIFCQYSSVSNLTKIYITLIVF